MEFQVTPPLPRYGTLQLSGSFLCSVGLAGAALDFRDIQIEALEIASGELSALPEALIRSLIQRFVAEALKRLPELPIPAFTLPASLARLGLPANQRLGLRQPSFSLSGAHGVLQGSLGLK